MSGFLLKITPNKKKNVHYILNDKHDKSMT